MTAKRKSLKMVAAGKKAWKTRLANLRKRKLKRKSKGQVVGFYKKDGKTRPITKPTAQLKLKKTVKKGKQFKGVFISQKKFGIRDLETFWGGYTDPTGEFNDGDLADIVSRWPQQKRDWFEKNTRVGELFDWKEEGELNKYLGSALSKKYPFVYNVKHTGEDQFAVLWSKVRIPKADKYRIRPTKTNVAMLWSGDWGTQFRLKSRTGYEQVDVYKPEKGKVLVSFVRRGRQDIILPYKKSYAGNESSIVRDAYEKLVSTGKLQPFDR